MNPLQEYETAPEGNWPISIVPEYTDRRLKWIHYPVLRDCCKWVEPPIDMGDDVIYAHMTSIWVARGPSCQWVRPRVI